MRIVEVTAPVKYDIRYLKQVPANYTQQFLDAELYVDLDHKVFKKWWTSPEEYFTAGGIFATAAVDNNVIAVAALQMPTETKVHTVQDTPIMMLRSLGLFVKEEHRGNKIAAALLNSIEHKVTSMVSAPDVYFGVFASGATASMIEKSSTRFITHTKLNQMMDKEEGIV